MHKESDNSWCADLTIIESVCDYMHRKNGDRLNPGELWQLKGANPQNYLKSAQKTKAVLNTLINIS